MRPPHARPVREDTPRESLAEVLLGGAALALWFFFLLIVLPVLT